MNTQKYDSFTGVWNINTPRKPELLMKIRKINGYLYRYPEVPCCPSCKQLIKEKVARCPICGQLICDD